MEYMSLSWSTPLRCNNNGALPVIPNEIYIEILLAFLPTGRVADTDDLKTLRSFALVCRFFCHIALPRIVERVTLDSSEVESAAVGRGRRMVSWSRAILAGEHPALATASYVKEVVFRNWELCTPLISPTALCCQAFARGMTNVQTVTFTESAVTSLHIQALRAWPNVRSIEFGFLVMWDKNAILSANIDPRAEGGLGKNVEYVLIADETYVLANWTWKALAASPMLQCIAVGDVKALEELGTFLKAEEATLGPSQLKESNTTSDLEQRTPTQRIREVHVLMPCLYRITGEYTDVFKNAKDWISYFPALERLRVVVRRGYADGVFKVGGLENIKKIISTVSGRLAGLRRLEIDGENPTDGASLTEDKVTEHSLWGLVDAISSELEYFGFGELEWRLEAGTWVQGTRDLTNHDTLPWTVSSVDSWKHR